MSDHIPCLRKETLIQCKNEHQTGVPSFAEKKKDGFKLGFMDTISKEKMQAFGECLVGSAQN